MSAQETTKDPDRAARIAELSPDKRALLARRLARATGLATQTPVAPAPRPRSCPFPLPSNGCGFWSNGKAAAERFTTLQKAGG